MYNSITKTKRHQLTQLSSAYNFYLFKKQKQKKIWHLIEVITTKVCVTRCGKHLKYTISNLQYCMMVLF